MANDYQRYSRFLSINTTNPSNANENKETNAAEVHQYEDHDSNNEIVANHHDWAHVVLAWFF